MARGRAPCCDKIGLKKGPWTPAEDMRLMAYVQKFGHGNWRALPKQAGLLRCGKSCRLRWTNYLRPDIKRGNFTAEEEEAIINLHELLGNKWSKIASQLPGRTDNEIKNVWNTHLKKRLVSKGPNPSEEKPKDSPSSSSSNSSISYCNRSEGTPNEDPTMNLVPSENTQDLQQDLIEIPIESNFDFWDMIDDNPPYLPERIGNNIMNILDTDNHKESSSSSSNSSVTTHCNQGEAKEFEEIPGPLYQSFHDMMPKENKPNKLELMEEVIPENTPIGLNLDFWGMLDDECRSFTSSVGLRCGNEGHQNTNLQEETAGDVGSWWITYLENELELWTASGDARKI